MSDRYDRLLPPSIIASVKSMPRRWADALSVQAPKNIEDYFTVAGPDGVSAAEDTGAMLAQAALLEDAIRTTSYNVPEALGSDVVAAANDRGSGPWPETATAALDAIEGRMDSIAARLDGLKPHDWNKQADTPDGPMTLTQLAQGLVRVTADRLARVDRTIRAVS